MESNKSDLDDRLRLLAIVIMVAGIIGLVLMQGEGVEWYMLNWWGRGFLRLTGLTSASAFQLFWNICWVIALAATGLLGWVAINHGTITAARVRERKLVIAIAIIGALAAITIENGYAAFLIFLLLGFPLQWWGDY